MTRALWSLLVGLTVLALLASGLLTRPAMAGCAPRASKQCCGARHAERDAARLMRTCCCAVDAPVAAAPMPPAGVTTPVALMPPAIAVVMVRASEPAQRLRPEVAEVAVGPPRSLLACAVAFLL